MPTVQEMLEAERATVGTLETVTTALGASVQKYTNRLSILIANRNAQDGETSELFSRLRIIGQQLKDLKRETATTVLYELPPESGPAEDTREENREIRRAMREGEHEDRPEPEMAESGRVRSGSAAAPRSSAVEPALHSADVPLQTHSEGHALEESRRVLREGMTGQPTPGPSDGPTTGKPPAGEKGSDARSAPKPEGQQRSESGKKADKG